MEKGRHSRPAQWGFAGLDLEIDLLNEKRAVTGATWTRSVKF